MQRLLLCRTQERWCMRKVGLLLISVLTVLSMFTSTAYAHNLGYNSVKSTSGGGDLKINDGTRYDASLDKAISAWQRLDCMWRGCPGVHVFRQCCGLGPAEVGIRDYYNRNSTTTGYYATGYDPDGIFLNVANVDKFPSNSWQRKAIIAHEIGHALGFDHAGSGSLMYYCTTCTGHSSPQNHDIDDYYRKWVG